MYHLIPTQQIYKVQTVHTSFPSFHYQGQEIYVYQKLEKLSLNFLLLLNKYNFYQLASASKRKKKAVFQYQKQLFCKVAIHDNYKPTNGNKVIQISKEKLHQLKRFLLQRLLLFLPKCSYIILSNFFLLSFSSMNEINTSM